MSCRRFAFSTLLACCLAAPASAYTIYLEDGSRILARSEYTVDGDKAIIVLESGTQTFLPLAEIDVERTVEANQGGAGSALIFQDGKFVERTGPIAPTAKRETVADLIARGKATMRGTTRSSADPDFDRPAEAATSGELVRRQPMRNLELAAALKTAFATRGYERVPVFQGTEASRPLVEMKADSEASAFHNLEIAADVLLEVRQAHPEECDVLELMMTTGNMERAGEFALTAGMAESLRAKEVELSTFYVRHVRF